MKVFWLFIFTFLLKALVFSHDVHSLKREALHPADEPPKPAYEAWLTGSLIVPQETVVPYGDFLVDSYIFCTTNTGIYNKHWNAVATPQNFFSLNTQVWFFLGITPWMDINIQPQFFYNTTSNQHSVSFADLPVGLDFQVIEKDAHEYFPSLKLSVGETFPTGPFENLNPTKLKTDQSGLGTFGTNLGLIFYKVYHLKQYHFLSTTYSLAYTVNTPVGVRGFNAYGGGHGTNGKVLPGNIFEAIIGFEITLTQNWAVAFDNVYTHTESTPFFGKVGKDASGNPAVMGFSSSEQISFAPSIEYNFSDSLGINAGFWFTAWGRNSTEFRSGVFNVTYTY